MNTYKVNAYKDFQVGLEPVAEHTTYRAKGRPPVVIPRLLALAFSLV